MPMSKCNCCNRRDAQVWTNGGPACDWCRDNCRLEPICDYFDLEINAVRVLDRDEEAEALRGFRPFDRT